MKKYLILFVGLVLAMGLVGCDIFPALRGQPIATAQPAAPLTEIVLVPNTGERPEWAPTEVSTPRPTITPETRFCSQKGQIRIEVRAVENGTQLTLFGEWKKIQFLEESLQMGVPKIFPQLTGEEIVTAIEAPRYLDGAKKFVFESEHPTRGLCFREELIPSP